MREKYSKKVKDAIYWYLIFTLDISNFSFDSIDKSPLNQKQYLNKASIIDMENIGLSVLAPVLNILSNMNKRQLFNDTIVADSEAA